MVPVMRVTPCEEAHHAKYHPHPRQCLGKIQISASALVLSRRAINLADIRKQPPVEQFAADGHLKLVKGVLHDVVGIVLVDPAHGGVGSGTAGLDGVGEEEELEPRLGGEALQAEVLRLHDLEARGGLGPREQGAVRKGAAASSSSAAAV